VLTKKKYIIWSVRNNNKVQMVPDLQFDFTMVQKWYACNRNCTSDFEVYSPPRLPVSVELFSLKDGQ
jgi:hypothetical protein